jgi:hypothetical protein
MGMLTSYLSWFAVGNGHCDSRDGGDGKIESLQLSEQMRTI